MFSALKHCLLLTLALYAIKESQISSPVPGIKTILTLLHEPQAHRKQPQPPLLYEIELTLSPKADQPDLQVVCFSSLLSHDSV